MMAVNSGGPADGDAGRPGAETPQRRATTHIARRVLGLRPGDRLPNIYELRTEIGVGTGTVQSALRELQTREAVTLKPRQRHGTIVVGRRVDVLWRSAELGSLVVILPLPNSWEFQGLASGLRAELDHLGVPSTLMYAHGSEQRATAVRESHGHVAVMSLAAGLFWQDRAGDIGVGLELPPATYYAADSVLVMASLARRDLPERPRVGIDRLSVDHTRLTEAEFPDADHVEVSYAQLPVALRRGAIDAAVWHRTALGLSLNDQGLRTWPLARPEALAVSDGLSAATLVVRGDDAASGGVLAELDIDRILAVQRSVVHGELLPLY
jgi:hypothetical protein